MSTLQKIRFFVLLLVHLLTIAGCSGEESQTAYIDDLKQRIQLSYEAKQLSVNELESAIQECDIALQNLQTTIDSDETNPEDCFYARIALKSIAKERSIYVKVLKKKLQRTRQGQKT